MPDYLTLALGIFLVIALILIYRQRGEINALSRKLEELNGSIPLLVENSISKTFTEFSGVFESIFSSAISKNTDVIKGAFATSLKELGIQEDLGKLSEASSDLKAITSDLKTMFQVKHSRAKFGELQLESLLKDIFPTNRIMFQKNIGIGIPDACVLVEDGKYLCIDSKFPLENFRRYAEAENEAEKRQYWNGFVKDLRKHVDDIRSKYVGKENTLDFALMFVPSDTIFYHLISEEPDLAVDASKAGVVLTSPSVLPAYLSLISARIQAQEISRRADEIQRKLGKMGEHIDNLEENLETLFRHVGNASKKASDVRTSFGNLKSFYSSVCSFEEVEE
ncbi:DNA recombination protein RmuC [Archaeoglobus sp.]|uniref:DNA recombination protein RmuC n=1 Tax=Archaeoglobus sp. TaxID=1872626 RepID=UPI0024AA7CBD|nr:DNA recombination protein RmuC [Archaeoglobus sp.]MDI3498301.1 recombination protein RmuC [Archaeoglobus sp.]